LACVIQVKEYNCQIINVGILGDEKVLVILIGIQTLLFSLARPWARSPGL
jgi:hypothetical protein